MPHAFLFHFSKGKIFDKTYASFAKSERLKLNLTSLVRPTEQSMELKRSLSIFLMLFNFRKVLEKVIALTSGTHKMFLT